MPLRSNIGPGRVFNDNELASRPLPEPAVVIDVRRIMSYDPPLAWHLTAELEDLSTRMRLQGVKRWRFLSECIEFITLDPLPPDRTVDTATRFTLIRGNGAIQSFAMKEELIDHLHKEYVDLVRTNRISAARDMDQSIISSGIPEVELERSTVRVFFLADMADPESLTNAAHYAALLRKKSEEHDNLLRSGREERISPIVICMNSDHLHVRLPETQRSSDSADMGSPARVIVMPDEEDASLSAYWTAAQYNKLFSSSISTAFDMIILLYAYRDDEGFVGNDAQLYELELILSTLLLAPETIARSHQDEYADRYLARGDLNEEHSLLPPGEVCMLGIASLEYSANWARRWLNYGLVKKLLQTIRETETIEDERNLYLSDGKDWLESWWADVRSILPRTMVNVLPGAKGFLEFQRRIDASPFQGVPLCDSLHALESFCQSVGDGYTGTRGATLQQALQSVEHAIPLLKEMPASQRKENRQHLSLDAEPLLELRTLQSRANLFSISLFKGATGALPRAISQLSELETRIEGGEIGHHSHHLPNLSRLREHFEEQGRKAQRSLALNVWQVPLFGRMLSSTLLSLCLVVLVVLVAWFLQGSLSFLPAILTHSLPQPGGISLFRLFIILVLALAEFLYLSRRDKRLRERRESILQPLCQTAMAHLTEVQLAVSATSALRLLQEAGLYHPKGKTGHYKQRLRALDKVLGEAQEQALLHHRGAYERLKLGLSPVQTGTQSSRTWLNLNTRKDLLPWEQTIETFQRLGDKFIQRNKDLDMLAESLLHQLTTEKAPATSLVPLDGQHFAVQESLQAIRSELIATFLVAQVVGSNLITLHPLLERYISLEQRNPYPPSLLGENIAELYTAVKAVKLEQAMNSDMGVGHQEAFENFMIKTKKPIEHMLVTWVENLYATDELSGLVSGSVFAHLQDFQIKLSDALEDLRRRCKMLGYRDESLNGSDAYMLLVPGTVGHDLQDALAALQLNQIRLLQFPDEEKLIYLHTYRVDIRF